MASVGGDAIKETVVDWRVQVVFPLPGDGIIESCARARRQDPFYASARAGTLCGPSLATNACGIVSGSHFDDGIKSQ